MAKCLSSYSLFCSGSKNSRNLGGGRVHKGKGVKTLFLNHFVLVFCFRLLSIQLHFEKYKSWGHNCMHMCVIVLWLLLYLARKKEGEAKQDTKFCELQKGKTGSSDLGLHSTFMWSCEFLLFLTIIIVLWLSHIDDSSNSLIVVTNLPMSLFYAQLNVVCKFL